MNDLKVYFDKINLKHFDGFLEAPELRWNSRLRSSAGRFRPGRRKFFQQCPPLIEIATYLQNHPQAAHLIEDTMGHEMIHYWLWVRRKPYGHSAGFVEKMKQMGVSRYNSAPKLRPYKYLYQCNKCGREFPTRKKLGTLACAECCKRHSNGKFDRQFILNLKSEFSSAEGLQLAEKTFLSRQAVANQ